VDVRLIDIAGPAVHGLTSQSSNHDAWLQSRFPFLRAFRGARDHVDGRERRRRRSSSAVPRRPGPVGAMPDPAASRTSKPIVARGYLDGKGSQRAVEPPPHAARRRRLLPALGMNPV